MVGHDVIAIGGSAGSLQVVMEIVGHLPADLPAATFIVIHSSPAHRSLLLEILSSRSRLPVSVPRDGTPIRPGHIYLAQQDHHLVLEHAVIRVTRGPRENRFRPAIDPLFRSAALAYGPRAIGVVLSGWLDDGAAGLWAIKTRGGIAIIQDPAEAVVDSMPRSALRQSRVDQCLRAADIAPALVQLASEPAAPPDDYPAPAALEIETRIAMEDKALETGLGEISEPSMFACPECHGVMLRLKTAGGLRYRCHTGHGYTADALLSEMTDVVENSLWNAIRAVQESALLMEHLASHARDAGDDRLAAMYRQKAEEAGARAEQVRGVVMDHERVSRDALSTNGHTPPSADEA